MKILIVDDCPTIRIRLKKCLARWGFEPVLADRASVALEMMQRNELPRLIIADWVMPEMDGPDLIEKIRQQDPDRDHYIIMLTAKMGRDVLETAFHCGADDYLTKPVVEEDLYRRICEGKNILERQDQVRSA